VDRWISAVRFGWIDYGAALTLAAMREWALGDRDPADLRGLPARTLDAASAATADLAGVPGARARVTDSWSIAGSVAELVSPARDADSEFQNYALPSRLPDASGHYTQHVSYADVNVALRF